MPKPVSDAVHRYFSYDSGINISKCNLCGNKIKGKHTTNLKSHIATKHNNAYNKLYTLNMTRESLKPRPKEKPDGEETPTQKAKYNFLIQRLTTLCMELVVIHGRPLELINDEPFRRMLEMAIPNSPVRAKEVNVKSVLAIIPATVDKIKMKMSAEIRNKLICLKVDSLTFKERRFVGVNIQYIKQDKIIVRNLAVIEIFRNQMDEFINERILETLNEFLIPTEQIYSLITDSGSNMKKLVKLFVDPDDFIDCNYEDGVYLSEDEEDNEEPEGSAYSDLLVIQNAVSTGCHKVRAMLCCARSLQLAIKDSIDENVQIQVTFDIARNVSRILRTPANRNLLELADLKVPSVDNATQWTTRYNMLVRLRYLKDFCQNIPDVTRLVSTEFWDEIDQLLICLKPFYDCTYNLQNDQLTIGDFYINWMKCKAKVNSIHHPLAASLRQAMERREKSLLEADVMLEALYLDGRLNVVLSPDQCEKAKMLLNQTREKLQQLPNRQDADDSNTDPFIEIKAEPEPSTSEGFDELEQMLMQSEIARGLQRPPTSSFNAALQELQSMSRLPVDTNIIEYWCTQLETGKSMLATVALTVFATPVTQGSVEQMYSSLKFMFNPQRSNFNASLLGEMVFIRANKDLLEA